MVLLRPQCRDLTSNIGAKSSDSCRKLLSTILDGVESDRCLDDAGQKKKNTSVCRMHTVRAGENFSAVHGSSGASGSPGGPCGYQEDIRPIKVSCN